MLKRLYNRLIDRDYFYSLLFGTAALMTVGISLTLSLELGVRAAYIPVGITLSYVLLRLSNHITPPTFNLRPATGTKISLAVASVTISATILMSTRFLPTVAGLVVVASIVGLQMCNDSINRHFLLQTTLLLLLSPTTKILTAGFYFGGSDLLIHTQYIKRLLMGHSITAMESSYTVYPGYHLLVGIGSLVTELRPYTAIVLMGLVVFAVCVPLIYKMVLILTESRKIAAAVTIGLTAMYPVSYFAAYFFPQSMATILTLFFVYVMFRTNRNHHRYTVLGLIFITVITIVHHYTVVLTLPALLVLYSFQRGDRSISGNWEITERIQQPQTLLLVLLVLIPVGYWSYIGEGFIFGFVIATTDIIRSSSRIFASQSVSDSSSLLLGTTLPATGLKNALRWIYTAEGIFQITLVAVLVAGMYGMFAHFKRYYSMIGFLVCGLFGSFIILKTPLVVKSLARMRLPWSFFVAFVIGVGLLQIRQVHTDRSVRSLVVVPVIVVLCVTAPLVAADDIGALRPDVPDQQKQQVAFSEREYKTLQQTSHFVQSRSSEVSGLWLTGRSLRHFGVEQFEPATVTDNGIRTPESLLIYRKSWSDYGVPAKIGLYFNLIFMSEEWLNKTVVTHNKVYDTGPTGIIWQRSNATIGPA